MPQQPNRPRSPEAFMLDLRVIYVTHVTYVIIYVTGVTYMICYKYDPTVLSILSRLVSRLGFKI